MPEPSELRLLRIAPLIRGGLAKPTGNGDTPYQRMILEPFRSEETDSDMHCMRLREVPLDADPESVRDRVISSLEAYLREQGHAPKVIRVDESWSLRCVEETANVSAPLSGDVAVVTGAAGAIGSGVCRGLLEKGCRVAAADLGGERLSSLVVEFESQGIGDGRIVTVPMDVTEPESVKQGFDAIVRKWGGVDIAVVNAGIAHVASIAEMTLDDFRRLEKVNVEGTLLTLAEAGRRMQAQGTGGDIVLISTKNVFSPGARFGAYSATKAGAHQLARIASLEMAEFDIRVNMVAPDAVFSEGERKSGLWETVGPDRMRHKGIDMKDLKKHYRNRNLLRATVTARHVANAVLFFVTRQTPTTGATIPIDGGLPDATPR